MVAHLLLWLLVYWRYGVRIETAVFMIFLSLLFTLAITDLETRLLPDRLTIPGIAVGVVARWLMTGNLMDGVVGAAVSLTLMVCITVVSRGGIGLGDAKLMGMIGAFLGWRDGLAALAIGAVFGGVAGAFLLSARLRKRNDLIAYGPFLALGAATVVLFRAWFAPFIAWL